jgi:hypothetical protein
MMDLDTDFPPLYVMADNFCQSCLPKQKQACGPAAQLCESEVMTLALFGQWVQFQSERAFYRYAQQHLRAAFPQLPARSQFNRHLREHRDAITAFGLHLVHLLRAQQCPSEVLESAAAVTRDAKRRGTGWLAGQADIGWSNRLGWYEGFHLLLAVNPRGDDHRLWLWACQHQRSPAGRDVLCPASPSPPGPGERGRPGFWAIRG